MYDLKEPSISKSEFRKLLNIRCHSELGVGYNDLPDIIDLEDVFWDGQTLKEANQMITGCIDDFKDELEYTPVHTINTPVYDINE
jgi:hypothetical protein